MSLKLLQLSDLHIGKEDLNTDDLFIYIKNAIVDNDYPVEAIAVTGDIFDANLFYGKNTNIGKVKIAINEAVRFFENLLNSLNKNGMNIKKKDILFIPGNHEIKRDINEKETSVLFDNYIDFLEKFYTGSVPDMYSKDYLSFLKVYENNNVILMGLNSTTPKKEHNNGSVSMAQIDNIKDQLKNISNIEEYNIIGMIHHHFYYIEDRNKDEKDISCLDNAETLLNSFNKYNLTTILHGHKHESKNRRINSVQDINKVDKIVNVIGCGSTDKGDVQNNNFNYVEIYSIEDKLDLRLIEFTRTNSTFEPSQPIELPLTQSFKTKLELYSNFEKYGGSYFKQYAEIFSIDTISRTTELMKILDSTIGQMSNTIESIERDYSILFYLFLPIHFRSAIHLNNDKYIDNLKSLVKSSLSNLNTDILNEVEKLLLCKDLYKCYSIFDNLINSTKIALLSKKHITFLMISIFLCDNYLVLTQNMSSFYDSHIKNKSNYNFDNSNIHNEIRGNEVEIISNQEKRAIEISVKCKTANAHKIVSLVAKEFELILNKYEKHFASIEFKAYYLIPSINKIVENGELKLQSYNFEAYIPKLITLLAGENIYSQREVFARELIQNSIDAIITRKKSKQFDFEGEGKIIIRTGQDNGVKYFEISDNGTGMPKHVIERYLTCIGRSFYTTDDFINLKTDHTPISKFGIGLLSCFMVGNRIEISTKYVNNHTGQNETHRLEIPNFDGCFFIEESVKSNIGTSLRVFDKYNLIETSGLEKYIKHNIQNVSVEMELNGIETPKFNTIKQILEKTRTHKVFLPIGIKQENGSLYDLDTEKYYNDDSYIDENPYGFFVYKEDNDFYTNQTLVCNSEGINVKIDWDAYIKIFGLYFSIYINLPSNASNIDVARESTNIKGIDTKEEITKHFIGLKNQLKSKKAYKNIPYFILNDCVNIGYIIDGDSKVKTKISECKCYFEENIQITNKLLSAFGLKVESIMKEDLAKYVARYVNRGMARDMYLDRYLDSDLVSDMAVAMDMARNIARDIDITTVMDMARNIARYRAMDMDIHMSRDVDRYMTRARGKQIVTYADSNTAMDELKNLARLQEIEVDADMAKLTITDVIKAQPNRIRENVLLYFLICCTEQKFNNANYLLFFLLSYQSFFISLFFTTQEVEDGVELDYSIIESIIRGC